jgi:adenylate cyclase, class 2
LLYKYQPAPPLKEILVKVHGVKVIVKKKRKIYFIKNVKFHFDTVEHLGTFVEVEAIDDSGYTNIEELKKQCIKYADFFGIKSSDYISVSYSDLILQG